MRAGIAKALFRKHVLKDNKENHNKAMPEDTETVEGCTALVLELTEGIRERDSQLESLTRDRGELVEDAALRLNGAEKLLRDIDDKIAFRSRDVAIKREALVSVQRRLQRAHERLARDRDKQRLLEMGTIAREILSASSGWTYHLKLAVEAASATKDAIARMKQLANTPAENNWLDRLIDSGPYLRAAEHAGLKPHLYITPYSGPSSHVIPLETFMKEMLTTWLIPAEPEWVEIRKERNPNQ